MHKGKVYRYSAYVVLTPQVIETKISTLDFIRQQAVHWCDYGSSADIE